MRDMKIIYKYLNIYNSSLWVICGLLGAHCSYDNPLDVRGGEFPSAYDFVQENSRWVSSGNSKATKTKETHRKS